MRHSVLVSFAVLVVASCSSGGGPTTTKTVDPPRLTSPPTASAIGPDSAILSLSTDRPTKAFAACPGREEVGSGQMATSHILVLRALSLNTPYNCPVRAEDGNGLVAQGMVSFTTRPEPCADPAVPTAKYEFYYRFPPEFRDQSKAVIAIRAYICGKNPVADGSAYAAEYMPEGPVRLEFSIPINRPFGSSDHAFCAWRGDGRALNGSEFTLRPVGGSGPAVHLVRPVHFSKPFVLVDEMVCWEFGMSKDTIYS